MANAPVLESNNTFFNVERGDESIEWVTPSSGGTLPTVQSLNYEDTVRILTERDPSLIVNEMLPEWKKENANMMKDMFNDILSAKSSVNKIDENFKSSCKKEEERGSVFEFWDIKNLNKKNYKTVNFSSKDSSDSLHKLNAFTCKNKESVGLKVDNSVLASNVFENDLKSFQKESQDRETNNQFAFNCNLEDKKNEIESSIYENNKSKNMMPVTKSPLKLFHDNFDTFTNNKLAAAVFELANQETDEDAKTSSSGPERKRARICHERTNSITTQNFFNEAQEVMERIRNRRNPVEKSILESVREEEIAYDSKNTALNVQKERDPSLKSKRSSMNSCAAVTNETPTRSMFSDWSSEHTSSKNTLISLSDSVKCHKEMEDLNTMESTKHQQGEKEEALNYAKQTWGKEPTIFQKTKISKPTSFVNKESNANRLNHKLFSSENLKVITPQDVSQFLSDKIGSMTLDKTKNTWVQDYHDKTEDVFEGIQDFPVSPESLDEIHKKDPNIFKDDAQNINEKPKVSFTKEIYIKKLEDKMKESLKKKVDKNIPETSTYPKNINFNQESVEDSSNEIIADDNLIGVNLDSEVAENHSSKSFMKGIKPVLQPSIDEKSLINENSVDIYKDLSDSKFLGDHPDLSSTTLNCSFSMAIQNLVVVLTDIEPYEPFWEKFQHLNLSNKNIESLIGLSDFCPKLNNLDVSYNKLTFLTGCPKTIRNMNLQNNNLSSLTGFSHLINIQYLNLSNNQIQSLKGLNVLVHLRQLDVSNNKISSLDGIEKLDGLLDLSLSHNLLCDIDLSDCDLPKLEQLNLCCNKIKRFKGVDNLQNLTILNLDKNSLSSFYAEKKMLRLRVLKLSKNFLKKFDPKNFPNLRILSLDNNSLQDINEIRSLGKLEKLSIRNQKLSKLNLELNSLMNIKKICISLNPICSLNFSSRLLTLQYLELVNVQMTALPQSFAEMALNIRMLNLSHNHLKDIGPLKGMPLLKRLFINGNQISKITDVIEVLSSLKALRDFDMRLNPCVINLYPPFFSLDPNNSSIFFGLQMKLYDNTWVEKDKEFVKTLPKKIQLRRKLYQDLILSSCPPLKWLNGKNITEIHIKNAIKFVSYISFDTNSKNK
ncbi:hypothetical protein PNEG_00743 [Pneumocystis murina B123]|uniref:Uncharacterized protein n=1 Tax=Pneumocystis murina (strain B123) TaxID=1069680 RepID=M7NV23_PNEMU|nr:hypothetical protein PNEG_00743 [Pneumocystis murina B123]EMR11147.1 hypothetical protein PNEG_00743 [Pneumocystis murina B123]